MSGNTEYTCYYSVCVAEFAAVTLHISPSKNRSDLQTLSTKCNKAFLTE